MTVWVLMDHDYESSTVAGVFASLEGAKEFHQHRAWEPMSPVLVALGEDDWWHCLAPDDNDDSLRCSSIIEYQELRP